MKATSLGLLLAGMAAQFLWAWAPTWAQADVWNAAGAIFIVLLLGVLAAAYRSYCTLVLVCCYLGLLWLMTAGCSMLWLFQQWPVAPGQDQCDARFKLPLSVMGLFIGLMVLVSIRSTHGGTDSKH